MSDLFEIKATANEQMLANMAAEVFIKHYRLTLDQFASASFSVDGDAYKKVADAWYMKLRSDRTIATLETTAQQIIDAKIKEASKTIGQGEEYDQALVKEITNVVFAQQQLVLETLVTEYFDRSGPAWRVIEDQFKMKMASQSLLRAIDTATNAHLENMANKKVHEFVKESESLVHDQISPHIQDTLINLIGSIDHEKLISEKFDTIVERLVYDISLEQARAGIGEVVHEEVMKKLPHAAVPYVGRVVDQLPYEAVLRHYLSKNAMPIMTDVIIKLSRSLLEKRFKPLIENQLAGLDPANFVMPEVVITGDEQKTVITITAQPAN